MVLGVGGLTVVDFFALVVSLLFFENGEEGPRLEGKEGGKGEEVYRERRTH